MRALAHPVRMKLLGLLSHAGTLTATEASEALGESPANCAFHLRTLAKYGFVEEAGGGRGRERPWRRTHAGLDITFSAGDDPEFNAAATAFAEQAYAGLMNAAASALRNWASWPAEIQQLKLPERASSLYLTEAESAELTRQLNEVIDQYAGRLSHPEQRPAGSVPIEVLLLSWPQLDKLKLSPHQRDQARPPEAVAPEAKEQPSG